MLPSKFRLSSDYDFRQVRRRGRQFGSPFFSLFSYSANLSQPSRFGFVVSAKLDKRATKRNRIRRIFQDEVGILLPKIKPGYVCGFWVKGSALLAKPEEVRAAIRKALSVSGVLR